jgi:hypothetical protein
MYDIFLPHCIYLPPSFLPSNTNKKRGLEHPAPTADQVLSFFYASYCYQLYFVLGVISLWASS